MTIDEIMAEIHSIDAESLIARYLLEWLIDNQGGKTESRPKVTVKATKREGERHYCGQCKYLVRFMTSNPGRLFPEEKTTCLLKKSTIGLTNIGCEKWTSGSQWNEDVKNGKSEEPETKPGKTADTLMRIYKKIDIHGQTKEPLTIEEMAILFGLANYFRERG